MIEKIVLDYLNQVLSVEAYMEHPENPPGSYVIIEKTGSSARDHIYSATLAIQSYGVDMYQAAQLNETVKEAMSAIVMLKEICGVRLNSDYNYTYTGMKGYRYQAVFDLTHYSHY